MNLGRLGRGEFLAVLGGLLLALSLFLPWYGTNPDNMIALVLVLYVGLVDRPGTPSSQISLKFGWVVALLGCAAAIVGGALRASGTERPRKPSGVL